MTPDSVEAILFRLAAIFTTKFAPQPGTIEEWASTAGIIEVDDDVAAEAVDRWKEAHDWPPTIAEFLDECERVVTGRRVARVAAIEQERAALLAAAEVDVDVSKSRLGAMAAATRAALGKAQQRRHVHTLGREACPACLAADEIAAEAELIFVNTLDRLGYERVDGNVFSCDECEDSGFVLDGEAGGYTFLRPCRRCNPALYEKWAGGHLAEGHTCPECAAIATAKPKRKLTEKSAPQFVSGTEMAQPRERDDERMF